MSTLPKVYATAPAALELEPGDYWWCACGRSKSQPLCDGSHKGTPFSPREFKPETTGEVWFCTCKRTTTPPMCDGSHKKLPA